MHKLLKLSNQQFFLACLLITLFSCVRDTSTSDKKQKLSQTDTKLSSSVILDAYDSIAIDICNCLQPMIDIVEESEMSKSDDDEKALIMQQNKIAKVRPQVESCTQNIKIRYEKIESPESNKKIMEALKKQCPSSYEIINKNTAIKL